MFPNDTRILIVDDMGPLRMIVRGQLKEMRFSDITEASDGHKAVEILNRDYNRNMPIDLILSDWNMPVMKGIDFLKIVREDARFKSLPFIMITAESERSLIMDAIKAGVSSYIMKPFSPAMLEGKLKTVWSKLNP